MPLKKIDELNKGFRKEKAKLHPKDSADYQVLTGETAQAQLGSSYALKMQYDIVLFYPQSVTLQDLPIWYAKNICVVVKGNLTVTEEIGVDDPCGLVVLGNVDCGSFSSSESEVYIQGTLRAQHYAGINFRGGGILKVGSIYTPVLIADVENVPGHSEVAHILSFDRGPREAKCREQLLSAWHKKHEREIRRALREGKQLFK